MQVHQTNYLIEIGFTPKSRPGRSAWSASPAIPGQIVLGHLSDRIGREWVWTVAALGFVLCYLCLLACARRTRAWSLLYVMVVAQGLLGYGLATVYGAIPAELFQGPHFGTIFGTLSSASILGAASGPWVAGRVYDRAHSYALGLLLAIALSLLSIACIWLAAPRKVRVVAGQIARLEARRATAAGSET